MGNQAETLRRVKAEIGQCIDDLGKGLLTVERLKSVSRTIDAAGRSSQDLLFLHAATASPASQIVGMRIIEDGDISDGPEDPDFDLAMADFSVGDQKTPTFRDQFRDCYDAAGMYAWLSGASD